MALRSVPVGYRQKADQEIRRALETLALLVPWDLPDHGKVLFGSAGDGAYVLVDICRPTQVILSFGIGPTVNFDWAMAERGHRIIMFDHTIEALPAEHQNFNWIRTGLAASSGSDPALATLEEHLAGLALGTDSPILKIDIEGTEWEVFAALPPHLLRRFEQITFEAHALDRIGELEFSSLVQRGLNNLNAQFTLVHVHANNFGGVCILADSVPVPYALELTYIRSDLVRRVVSNTFYPTPIDRPNFHILPEVNLWFYPFLPGSEKARV